MRVVAAAALIVLTSPALAQEHARPETVRGLCQKDGCDEFSVVRVDRIRADEEGTLFRTRIRTYHANGQGRVERGEDTGFVFCSLMRPTVLAQSDGKVAGFQIATAPTQESRETLRQQANYHAMYFTICHGAEAGRAAVQDMQSVARQFGYRSPLAQSVMVHFASPEEVFSRPTRQAARELTPPREVLPGPVPQVRREDTSPQETFSRPTPQVRREDEPGIARPRFGENRDGGLLPPRDIPEARAPLPRPERWVERRWEDRRVERRPADEDDIVIFRDRPAIGERPWYRQPERWLEGINPF